MSLPTAPVATALLSESTMAPLDIALASLNSNPYFIGTMMLILNFGGRFLPMEMTKDQEQFFQNKWVRRFLIFIVIFIGTRNVLVAFWMSLFIILCIGYLFNENSSLCIFHLGSEGSKCAKEGIIQVGGLTQEESEILKRLQDKQQRLSPPNKQQEVSKEKKNPSDIYWQNMFFMNNPRF
jgi:hypothetical protein